MHIRNVLSSDYTPVISVLNEWWGGRHMSDMLPKLFFIHFNKTSYIADEHTEIIGFIIGFVSQTNPEEAYIHFLGIHPDYRRKGVASKLYNHFFDIVRGMDCKVVKCVTSTVNKPSINFHRAMGFQVEKGSAEIEGVSFHSDYDGPGEHRVLFMKNLF
jgi:ribosomal protein S18 acetylase RimI-like enzyme